MTESYSELPNKRVSAANGIDYAYRETGEGTVPLVLLQHFRGNLDNWDPALIDALAATRHVVTFDNAGVGGSTGTTPNVVEQMARDAIAFLAAVGFGQADILGSSIGSFVAQEIALVSPGVLRRMILASSAPQGAAGMHGWAADVIGAVGAPEVGPDGVLDVFYTRSPESREAGGQSLQRMFARTQDRDQATTWETRQAQYDAVGVCRRCGRIPRRGPEPTGYSIVVAAPPGPRGPSTTMACTLTNSRMPWTDSSRP